MPRNMTGGSSHKKQKKGAAGWRGAKAVSAADDMLSLILGREDGSNSGQQEMELLVLQVGRIVKRMGEWMDVYCEDGFERRCLIRGVLRAKKGGSFMDVGSIVVVALDRPEEDPEKPKITKGYIVGIFDGHLIGKLQLTNVNRRLFDMAAGGDALAEDYFDRSGSVEEVDVDAI